MKLTNERGGVENEQQFAITRAETFLERKILTLKNRIQKMATECRAAKSVLKQLQASKNN